MKGTVVLKRNREKPVRNRHPWIFSGAIQRIEGAVQDGDLVRVTSSQGQYLATGYLNRRSQIAVRLLTWDAGEQVDGEFWRRRLERALAGRAGLAGDPATTAYRLVHAEADGLPGLVVDRYGDFSALKRGHGRKAYNVFYGERNDCHVICFDYQYETGFGDDETTHYLSMAMIDLRVRTPYLLVRTEHFLDKVAEFVGFDDIDFESAEFSRQFLVKSDNRKFAFDVFHPRAMEYMLSLRRRYTMEWINGMVLVYDDRTWHRPQFKAAIRQVEGLVALFPDYLRRALREGTV